MPRKRVVLGGDLGCLTAALAVRNELQRNFMWKTRHGYVDLP
jgi:hypothetical protein